jgi:hypothetical protein
VGSPNADRRSFDPDQAEGQMVQAVDAIAVARGAPLEVANTFKTLVALWQPTLRLAGLIAETHGLPDRRCNAGYLRSVTTGERYSIFQDFGPGSAVCHLDGDGVAGAARAVQRDLGVGYDLVLLSKFGRLEASGQGLAGAFRTALEARTPLLTSVSSALEEVFAEFVGRSFVVLPADPVAIDNWWRTLGQPAQLFNRDPSRALRADG